MPRSNKPSNEMLIQRRRKTSISKRAYNLVVAFESAVRSHEMMGAADPESWTEIKKDFADAYAAMYNMILDLERGQHITRREAKAKRKTLHARTR